MFYTHLSPDGYRVSIKVLDLNGAVLKSISTGETHVKLNIEDLSVGMHLIEIEYQDGKKVHERFIIIK